MPASSTLSAVPPAGWEYGISRYPDTADVYARLNALVKQPMRPIARDNMNAVLRQLDERCAKSKQLFERAQTVIPGGVQHNLAFNYPFALAMDKTEGAHLWDVDGNQYIDFLQAGGPTLLGSNYRPVLDKVVELL